MLAYRRDIDGIRAVAVLSVLVFHFDLAAGGKAGFMGVDVFFVISGFLITSIVKRQLDDGSFSLRAFYLGRIRRLAPALFATLLLVTAAGAYWLFPADFLELVRQALASQAYVANIYFWQNVNYFGLGAGNVFLLHTWSLAVEEQFYLVYPLALLLVYRLGNRAFWPSLVAAFLLSFGLNVLLVEGRPQSAFYLLPTRAWELLAGALIPLLGRVLPRTSGADEVLGVVGVVLIVASFVLFGEETLFPGYFALLPTLGAVALIHSGASGRTRVARLLSLQPIVYVGKISYSLYLVHWPVNVFASKLLGDGYSHTWRIALFCACFVLSAALYHGIENPFRRRLWFPSGPSLIRAYAAGIAATVSLFAAAQAFDGLPRRFRGDVVRLAHYVDDRTPPLPCQYVRQTRLDEQSFCRIGAPDRKPTWIVYGDSHAWAAHSAFDAWLARNGEAGLFAYQAACPPLAGLHLFRDGGRCAAFNSAVLHFLARTDAIRNVLLVSTWRQASEGALSTSPEKKLTKEQSTALFAAQFSRTLDRLGESGRRVYVWEPVPGARRSVPLALARALLDGEAANIEFDREEYASYYEFFFSALEKNRDRIALSFSPAAAVCGSGRCASTVNGVPLYFDNAHVTRSSAGFWAKMLEDQYRQGGQGRPAIGRGKHSGG